MKRRLEDRIEELCARIRAAENADGLQQCIELRGALREHVNRVRSKLAQYPRAEARRFQERLLAESSHQVFNERLRNSPDNERRFCALRELVAQCLGLKETNKNAA